MAEEIFAPETGGGGFAPHPVGQFIAYCADAMYLGERVEDFPGRPPKLTPKAALVFRTGEISPDDGKPLDVVVEFTLSSGEKANLRKFMEAWRGAKYDKIPEGGIPMHKTVNQDALITVGHTVSKGGRTYANITSAVQLFKGLAPLARTPYTRPEYLIKRKEAYAIDAAAFRAKVTPVATVSAPNIPQPTAEQSVERMVASEAAAQDGLPFDGVPGMPEPHPSGLSSNGLDAPPF